MAPTTWLARANAPWMLFEWACEGDSKLAQWFVDLTRSSSTSSSAVGSAQFSACRACGGLDAAGL
eukprot:12062110-Heterocapsa_arctica.AAC.1